MLHGLPTATNSDGAPVAAAIAQRKAAADAAAASHVNGVAGPSEAGDVEMAVVNGTSPAHDANGSAGRWVSVRCCCWCSEGASALRWQDVLLRAGLLWGYYSATLSQYGHIRIDVSATIHCRTAQLHDWTRCAAAETPRWQEKRMQQTARRPR